MVLRKMKMFLFFSFMSIYSLSAMEIQQDSFFRFLDEGAKERRKLHNNVKKKFKRDARPDERNEDVSLKDFDDWVQKYSVSVAKVEEYLNSGGSLWNKTDEGSLHLHYIVACCSDPEVIRFVLAAAERTYDRNEYNSAEEAMVDYVNTQDKYGDSILHAVAMACFGILHDLSRLAFAEQKAFDVVGFVETLKFDEVVELLLEKGANPLLRNKCQMTPLHSAAQHNPCSKVIDLLCDAAEKLVEDTTYVNWRDYENKTALQVAEYFYANEAVKEAISKRERGQLNCSG